jgi:prepilin-type processing-associated H-X9-DG protein
MILPHVGFQNLFNDCVDGKVWWGATGYGGTPSHTDITQDVTVCPSRADNYQLGYGGINMTYKANGAGAGGSFNRNDGAIGDNANNVFVSLADVSSADGASTTLLIAEGTRDRWFPNTWSDSGNMAGKTSVGTFIAVGGGQYPNNATPPRNVHPDPGGNLLFGFSQSGTVNSTTRVVNNRPAVAFLPGTIDNNIGGNVSKFAHPDGANVAFVDGSWRFLSTQIAPHVYGHLVTHRSVWDGASYSTNSPRANVFLMSQPAPATHPYVFKPGDY